MPAVAKALLGEPMAALSSARDWRWGRRGSLSVDPARGLWWDFERGVGGGVIDLVAHVLQCDRTAARRWLGHANLPSLPRVQSKPAETDDPAERRKRAMALWNAAQPPGSTPVATYLAGRGLPDILEHPALRPVIRFHPACPYERQRVPAMLALLTAVADARPLAIRRTALGGDGTRRLDAAGGKLPHKALGPCAGAVVRLSGPDRPGDALAVCEGLETGLSLLAAGVAPLWACLSAGTLRALPVLPGVKCLLVFADHDPPGLDAARMLARRWADTGRTASVRMPETPGHDFNDAWQVKRHGR
jgi:hypothetical protein